jgi:2-octaprenyl-6-methoxyphenol hydroxylase
MQAYDVVIVGGGPIGAALAIALQGSGLTVLVLEARPDAGNSNDARTLAMSYGSRLILERLGIWSQIEAVTPIESIHVSQRGGFGRTLLSADEAGLPALGYVVRYARLQQALGEAIGSEHTTLKVGAEVIGMDSTTGAVSIGYRAQGIMQSAAARLLVIADGGAGTGLRTGAAMKVREYGQDAVVGLVETSRPHGYRAFERFTPDGPIALLPSENRFALVWTATPEAANAVMELPPPAFLEKLQRHFGDRAGRFISIGARARFPLVLRYASDPVWPRVVMLGNAAQTLHPIAGQGFNLGLRDVWELGQTLWLNAARDPGADQCLSSYRTTRRPDRLQGIALTHSLVKIFSNDIAPLRAARGAALALIEVVAPAKRAFMQQMIFGASL